MLWRLSWENQPCRTAPGLGFSQHGIWLPREREYPRKEHWRTNTQRKRFWCVSWGSLPSQTVSLLYSFSYQWGSEANPGTSGRQWLSLLKRALAASLYRIACGTGDTAWLSLENTVYLSDWELPKYLQLFLFYFLSSLHSTHFNSWLKF